MVRNRVFQFFSVAVLLIGAFLGYKYFRGDRGSGLPPLRWDQDQGATWNYNPILQNRARISAEADRKPQAATCEPESSRRDANGWLKWRRDVANEWVSTKRIDHSVTEEINNCKTQLESLNLWNCFNNTKNFAFQATLGRTGHKLGFEMKDTDYYAKILEYDPEALSLPAELEKGVPDQVSKFGLADETKTKSYEGLAKLNTLPNWRAINYHSRTVANPSDTGVKSYNRLLFLNTTKRYDKYIQFTLAPGTETDPFGNTGLPQQLVDFISVEKVDKNNQPIEKPVIRFAQYYRDAEGRNPKPRLDYRSGNGNADTCYTCHPNGMRYLSPLPSSVGPQQAKILQTINDRMASYKVVDWMGAIHPDYYGPPRGATVGCMDCHNSGYLGSLDQIRRGPLNAFTATSHISHKLRTDMSMTQARAKGHLAVVSSVRGIDRFVADDSEINKKLSVARNKLFKDWADEPGQIDFERAFEGSQKMAKVAATAHLEWLPKELQPNEELEESMDQFLKDVVQDQALIEKTLFTPQSGGSVDDKRYQIETANWLEMRCPDTPVEGRE